ncbi:magnesium chelatase ATPase subunit I [Chlorobium phaeobacteroides]|jgi:magnesium chelatase subunit I|uniref:Mg-protoporphyrin IX chelatase n=1 Tax=Chlorobium phaeobacteroides (strain DSM 266 / SMG 266 / 2430) TaxID=290317 RepID=A1BGX5_CHLPD|nr:magnesium chelatase ATPase subunit I [Chlorobium phaeobacteroides]ABL65652.1 protoporphyrin IX magnesium-chelatase [Chlorobium phaeobacteroides DSM 266]MBV5328383.1 magnesium chelatase ATPase subunit I [Chlorobium sp.]
MTQTETATKKTAAAKVKAGSVASEAPEQKKAKPAAKKKSGQAFPFTAIVGQEEMKLSLILNIIDPRIGGVLVMGHRGTGKSTTVRALAEVLPLIERVKDDTYNRTPDQYLEGEDAKKGRKVIDPLSIKTEMIPVPVVDLPLGATEDRVCGTIDIEQALTSGVKAFEPGLLAQANRGFLYIDEVNLLDDHLVDVLLDVAASGKNVVEREGISIRHPARFVLVGSGNPEEGELRPQLLDRFGLHARIITILDVAKRVEIVKRRRDFDEDPDAFMKKYNREQLKLQKKIQQAKDLLPEVTMNDLVLTDIAKLCMNLGIDGHRGELTITRTAHAHAAFLGHKEVTMNHVREIAGLCLRHRLRKDPLETLDAGEKIDRELAKVLGEVEATV